MGQILADGDNLYLRLIPVLTGKSSLAVTLLGEKGASLGTVCDSGIGCLYLYQYLSVLLSEATGSNLEFSS